jgi:hypothetical protein
LISESDKKDLLRRIALAKSDLTRRAPLINEVYRLGIPYRAQVGAAANAAPLTEDDIADILDSTLEEAIGDFSSDMISVFTPPHEPWATLEPTQMLNKDQRRAIKDQLSQSVAWFWDDVSDSSYYDAADECFHDLAAGTMGVIIRDQGKDEQIAYEPIPISQLLIDEGAFGTGPDLRCVDAMVEKRLITQHYGRFMEWPEYSTTQAKFKDAKSETKFRLRDGIHVALTAKGTRQKQWRRYVFIDDECVYEQYLPDGEQTIVVARWRTERASAYGLGAAWIACAPQRVLGELHALTLAQMHNVVDPAHAYFDPSGVANLEQGIGSGDWVQMGEGFNVEKLSGDAEFSAAFYKAEELRMLVKRALFQDKPEQRGDTPPSATQWADEAARTQQRFEIPRGKIIREWVLPIVGGHLSRRIRHGLMPPIKLGSKSIMLKPTSPQTKARAFERVTKAERVLAVTNSPALQQASMAAIDALETLRNIKEEIGDDVVVLRTQEQLDELAQKAAAMSGMSQEGAPPNGQQPAQAPI